MGRFEDADHHARSAIEQFGRGHNVGFKGLYYAGLAEGALWRAQLDEVRAHVATGLSHIAGSDDVRWIGQLTWLGIRSEADRAQFAEWRRDDVEVRTAREEAERLLGAFVPVARRAVDRSTIFKHQVRGPLGLAEAEVARLGGTPDPGQWEVAAAVWRELREPYPLSYALYRQAEAFLVAGGSRRDASEPLREAHAIATRIGADPMRREIESLGRRGRVELAEDAGAPPSTPGAGTPGTRLERRSRPRKDVTLLDAYGLTPREREVLTLLADGHAQAAIADELFITPKTVATHIERILEKLGVRSRAQAVALAHKEGILASA